MTVRRLPAKAVRCFSPSDLMRVRKEKDGSRRYFRAHSALHEEFTYQRPFILELEITRQCNLRCVHCYAEAENRRFDDELTFEEIDAVLDSAEKIGIPELSLTGGEVMLRADFLDIIDAGILHGMNVRFVSNGTLLDDAMLEALARRPIKLVTVSLDALSQKAHEAIRGKGSHARAIDNTLRLKRAGFKVSIITAFSKLNIDEFDSLLAFCRQQQLHWQVQLTSAKGRCAKDHTLSPDEYYALGEKTAAAYATQDTGSRLIPMDDLATFSHFAPLNQLSKTWQGRCTGGLLNLFVRANGAVTPCSALCFQSCIVGNVREDRLESICIEERCKKALDVFSKETRRGPCQSCAFLDDCGGGCPEILLSMCKTPYENEYCYHRIEQDRILKEAF